MGKKPPARWSFQAWNLVFEAGLGLAVLIGMLALWLSLSASPQLATPSPPHALALCNRSLYPPPWTLRSDQLTILINGFIESRLPLLQSTLRTYSSSPRVHSIFVLWSNTSTPDSTLHSITRLQTLGAPIILVRQASTSLNDRFLPREQVKTKAVLVCDDDVTVEVGNVEFALQVWREHHGRRIVGFFPRVHVYSLETKAWVYAKDERKYSIMLTKSMVLATENLYRYWCEIPSGVREYVDQGMNCEDIAMNFLVSNLSDSGPLLVEGQPRDWGDSRNSGAKELTSMGLSARADHRKNRGDCILAFQRLWKGMPLRFSYSKAVHNVEEQVKCEKLGHLIDCDLSVISVRDVRRQAGHQFVKQTLRFAYVTLLLTEGNFYAALVWAQAIRNAGSVHDLVLLLDGRSGIATDNDTLSQHFDVIHPVSPPHSQLHAWSLHSYERIVYIDLHLLPLTNLDFLFGLPEPAAAPLTTRPQEFHSGLLVLRPSNATFTEAVRWWEERGEGGDPHRVWNGFFSEWWYMGAEHRLPLRLNMPLKLSSLAPPTAWPGVLQYPERELQSLQAMWRTSTQITFDFGQNQTSFALWLEILSALRSNKYQPLDDEKIAHLSWKPTSSLSWPPTKLSLNPKPRPPSNPKPRKAFATVLASVEDLPALGGWISTFSRFHKPGHESLLLVPSSLNPHQQKSWKVLETVFDSVVVVNVDENVVELQQQCLLHLWNQTSYDKLVFVNPKSLFLRNCDGLMEMEAFAAAPDFVRPDTFSLQVLVIQPDHGTFVELSRRRFAADEAPVARVLNEFYGFWYSSSTQHRVGAISNAEEEGWGWWKRRQHMEWKIFSFYSRNPFADRESAVVWRKYVCGGGRGTRRVEEGLTKHLNLCNFKPL